MTKQDKLRMLCDSPPILMPKTFTEFDGLVCIFLGTALKTSWLISKQDKLKGLTQTRCMYCLQEICVK